MTNSNTTTQVDVTYKAIYRSAPDGKRYISTQAKTDPNFPASISYDSQSFAHVSTFIVDTPTQQQQFSHYCKQRNIEQEVAI